MPCDPQATGVRLTEPRAGVGGHESEEASTPQCSVPCARTPCRCPGTGTAWPMAGEGTRWAQSPNEELVWGHGALAAV